MQVEPQTPLPLVYQISDHTDESRDAYYVRAVVRDSLTAAIIQTKNLTSAGSGRYTGQFNAPVDGTGLGRQIDVTTVVFTDANYTTKHPAYAEVLERWYVKSAPVHYAGGGGEEVDYDRIAKLIDAAVSAKEESAEPVTEPEPVDLSPILKAIAALPGAVAAQIEIPEPPKAEKVDLTPVVEAVSKVGRKVEGGTALLKSMKREEQEQPQQPSDPKPVLEALTKLSKTLNEVRDLLKSQGKDTAATVEKTLREFQSEHAGRNEKVKAAVLELLGASEPSSTPKAKQTPYAHLFKD